MNLHSYRFFKMIPLLMVLLIGCQKEEQKPTGIETAFMDTSVRPQDDFFRYVNGKWLDQTQIPADKTSWGSFNELRENTDSDVLAILKEAIASGAYSAETDQGKAVNLFKSILDSTARQSQGITPIQARLDEINNIKNPEDLQAYLVKYGPVGGTGFFGVNVFPDSKDSNKNVLYLGNGPLGLPDREYYVSDDPNSVDTRTKYLAHVARMLQFIGYDAPSAEVAAQDILSFETKMAEPRLTRVERRDDRLTYNPMAVSDLGNLNSAIKWDAYLSGLGFTDIDTLIVSEPKYISSLQSLFDNQQMGSVINYLKWTLLNAASGRLTPELETASWEFYGKTLRGAQSQEEPEKRALSTLNRSLGEALGKLYVDKKFPPEAKQKAEELIQNLILAYDKRIKALPWMSEETKQKALEKLHALRIKIAYPDKWKDYSQLQISGPEQGGSYYDNMQNVARWNFEEDLAKLQKPVDKDEWFMAPQIVNAYFNPSYNEIVFPAAILQPPFFNFEADDAVNYGGIGAVIGHEISHGFDDSGARYDADGNLVDWWTEDDLRQFTELGDALAAQYSALEPLPDTFVDGKFTLGENIGDLGGVNAAFEALKIYLEKKGSPGEIDGFTPEQRFFLSWGTIWRVKTRDEALKTQVKTDPHAPGMYRAYVPLQNVDAFYEAFNIKEGDKLYLPPDQRVKIW